jgi:hypothetical protein
MPLKLWNRTSTGIGVLVVALILGRRLNYGPSIMVPHVTIADSLLIFDKSGCR